MKHAIKIEMRTGKTYVMGNEDKINHIKEVKRFPGKLTPNKGVVILQRVDRKTRVRTKDSLKHIMPRKAAVGVKIDQFHEGLQVRCQEHSVYQKKLF